MNFSAFKRELVSAYQHQGGIKTLSLGKIEPSWFAAIQKEAATIINSAESSDVTDGAHVTNWTRPTGSVRQFSLFNSSGRSKDFTGDYGYLDDQGEKRLVFPEMKAIARFADLFKGSLRNLRLNGMGTSSNLNAHEEQSITSSKWSRQHIVRFHLPLFTNPAAWMFLDDEKFHYDEGTLYFFHHGCVHAASNDGTEARYHFVLDCFLTSELFDNVISESGDAPGLARHRGTDRILTSQPHHFPNFVREGGRIIEGPINYGRKAPAALDYWRKNYPSIFGAPA